MINIAVLGFGTVGSGVADVIEAGYNLICKEVHEEINIKYILDMRDFPDSPYADRVVHDFSIILNDPEVKIVVEAMGGLSVPFEYTMASLNAGKHVVTSNKAVVAAYGKLLIDVARSHGVRYLYEASVAGGIPVIRTIATSLCANEILEINGILNGTTNFILTNMKKNGMSFEDALAEAQRLGYAERDPRADVEGEDACRKICILAALSFGVLIPTHMVNCEGISKITQNDFDIAAKAGYTIKLIANTARHRDGKIEIWVAPCFVSQENSLAPVDGVFNAVRINSQCLGVTMHYGAGAGKLPTASAVVSDVVDIAKHLNAKQPNQDAWEIAGDFVVRDSYDISANYFVCLSAPIKDCEGAKVVFEEEGRIGYLFSDVTRYNLDAKLRKLSAEPICIFRTV